MGTQSYICTECLREFVIRYLWSKPGEVSCPKCGSKKVAEIYKGCNCSRPAEDPKGPTFT